MDLKPIGGKKNKKKRRKNPNQHHPQKVCHHWKAGKCRRFHCPFLHVELPLPLSLASTSNGGAVDKDFCMGENPNFSNVWSRISGFRVSNKSTEKVCNYWVQGICGYEDKCKFLHSPSIGDSFSTSMQTLEGHQKVGTGIALPPGKDELDTGQVSFSLHRESSPPCPASTSSNGGASKGPHSLGGAGNEDLTTRKSPDLNNVRGKVDGGGFSLKSTTSVCTFWGPGTTCNYGDKCKFSRLEGHPKVVTGMALPSETEKDDLYTESKVEHVRICDSKLSCPPPTSSNGGASNGPNSSGGAGDEDVSTLKSPDFSNTWFRLGVGEGPMKKEIRFCDNWLQRDCKNGNKCKYFHYCSIGDSFSLLTTLEGQQKVADGTDKQAPPQPTSSSIPSTSQPPPFRSTTKPFTLETCFI